MLGIPDDYFMAINGALQLDGVNGYLVTGPILNPLDRPFCIFAWIQGGAPHKVDFFNIFIISPIPISSI